MSDITKAIRRRTTEEQLRDLKARVRTLEGTVQRLTDYVAETERRKAEALAAFNKGRP